MAKLASTSAILMAASLAAPGTAQVTETSTIVNSVSYFVGNTFDSIDDVGPTANFRIADYGNGFASEMTLDLTSTLDDNGNFFFLHNGVCVGLCRVTIETKIYFTLTNEGTEPVDLRFDSLITPGHLARTNFFGPGDGEGGIFRFSITQDPDTTNTLLYEALGNASGNDPNQTGDQITITTTDGSVFTGLDSNFNEPDWNVLDWSATGLNLNIPTLGAGESTVILYYSLLALSTSDSQCVDATQCAGFQVAFGDPRNSGGVTDLRAFGALDSDVIPAIGSPYGTYTNPFQFVTADTPEPDVPPPNAPVPYNGTYVPFGDAAVPEPSSWALMLLGAAAIGGALRRRAKAVATA